MKVTLIAVLAVIVLCFAFSPNITSTRLASASFPLFQIGNYPFDVEATKGVHIVNGSEQGSVGAFLIWLGPAGEFLVLHRFSLARATIAVLGASLAVASAFYFQRRRGSASSALRAR